MQVGTTAVRGLATGAEVVNQSRAQDAARNLRDARPGGSVTRRWTRRSTGAIAGAGLLESGTSLMQGNPGQAMASMVSTAGNFLTARGGSTRTRMMGVPLMLGGELGKAYLQHQANMARYRSAQSRRRGIEEEVS